MMAHGKINLIYVAINKVCLVENHAFIKMALNNNNAIYLLVDAGAQVSIIREKTYNWLNQMLPDLV